MYLYLIQHGEAKGKKEGVKDSFLYGDAHRRS